MVLGAEFLYESIDCYVIQRKEMLSYGIKCELEYSHMGRELM
jgi:hypothetical protein